MRTRDPERAEYIFAQRKTGRTFKDIGLELGITPNRVREIYVYVCRDRRQQYFKTHPGEYEQWHNDPNNKKWDLPPYVE